MKEQLTNCHLTKKKAYSPLDEEIIENHLLGKIQNNFKQEPIENV